MLRAKIAMLFIALLVYFPSTSALTYEITPGSDIVGDLQYYVIKKGDTLTEIARKFDLGYLELIEANPNISSAKKIKPGTQLLIPTRFVLPSGVAREGIILNLAELRLYYFIPNTNKVVTFPVAIGRDGWGTPVGETKIVKKRENPIWVPPDGIRAEAEANGYELPEAVAAGPHNPLGSYALNLGWTNYRMHGTNAPGTIGMRSTHGCIRMFPEDIEILFHLVDVGTPVNVIHAPFKFGIKDGEVFFEAHKPFSEEYYTHGQSLGEMVDGSLFHLNYPNVHGHINWPIINKLIEQNHGYPVQITNLPKN